MKKTPIIMAIAAALAIPGTAFTAGEDTNAIEIDFDGSGGNDPVLVGALDWSPGAALADDSAITDVGGDFTLYAHASLAGYIDEGGAAKSITGVNTLNTDFEWTYIVAVDEEVLARSTPTTTLVDDGGDGVGGGNDVYKISQTATFGLDDTQDAFFFQIYYDENVNANSVTGVGYDDGTLILSASSIDFLEGDFNTSNLVHFVDLDNSGTLNSSAEILESEYPDLDAFTSEDWNGIVSAQDYLSVEGTGSTKLEATVDTDAGGIQDFDFFLDELSTILSNLVFSTQNVDPFLQTNPSYCYDNDGTTTSDTNASTECVQDGDIVFGTLASGDFVNGADPVAFACFTAAAEADEVPDCDTTLRDVLFQTDANTGFRIEEKVPEPTSLLLLGSGLSLLGFSTAVRRRRKKATR